MKAKELLSKLSAFDSGHEVLCCCEDEGLLPDKHGFRLFEIIDVSRTEGGRTRGEDGIPSLELGETEYSSPHILIGVTSDF